MAPPVLLSVLLPDYFNDLMPGPAPLMAPEPRIKRCSTLACRSFLLRYVNMLRPCCVAPVSALKFIPMSVFFYPGGSNKTIARLLRLTVASTQQCRVGVKKPVAN